VCIWHWRSEVHPSGIAKDRGTHNCIARASTRESGPRFWPAHCCRAQATPRFGVWVCLAPVLILSVLAARAPTGNTVA